MLKINKGNVLDILQAAVDKYADGGDPYSTFRECEYVSSTWDTITADSQPVCVVGCVLIDAGVPVTLFTEFHKEDPENEFSVIVRVNNQSIKPLLRDNVFGEYVEVEDEIAEKVITNAQRSQDDGKDWGYMMENARHVYSMLTGIDY